jgi:outer-membrane receptor for ferric coprogen and ferric-rhodotorulic acid
MPKLRGGKLPIIIGLAWMQAAGAAPAGERAEYSLEIDGESLGLALQDLARQTGTQIIFFSKLTEGLHSPAVRGRHTIADALNLLLEGSTLTFRVVNQKTIEIHAAATGESQAPPAIRNAAPVKLKPAASNAAGQGPTKPAVTSAAVDEIVVKGTAEWLAATRTETPLREIPQTISIVSAEQIRQQNDTDLADALSNAVGITAVQNNSLDRSFFSRGFEVSTFHLDGGAALNSFSNTPIFGTPDLGEFDHIEVLRGADALFGGLGNPGATVSLVRKRPLGTAQVVFDAFGGSWNNYRIEGDATGPLGFGDALRARVDAVYAHRDYFYETARLQKRKVFGVLEYDLSARTLLSLGGSYQWTQALPFISGLPFYADGSDAHLPRKTSLSFDWSHYDTQTRETYLQLQQKFGDVWKLKLNATSLDTTADYGYGGFQSPIDPNTGGLPVPPSAILGARPSTQDQFALDATVTGRFSWAGRRIDVALGGDYTHVRGDVTIDSVNAFGPLVSNVFAYDPAAYPSIPTPSPLDLPRLRSRSSANQTGAFGTTRLFLQDDLSIVAGARLSINRASNVVSFTLFGAPATINEQANDPRKVAPYGGIVYDLSPHYSLYASYADIYLSNEGSRQADGKFLPPINGVDVEAGIKGAWRDGAVNGSLVIYGIDQHGVAVTDLLASQAAKQKFAPLCCSLPDGSNRSKGVDAELSGSLATGWLAGAGYTYNINRADVPGALSSQTPRHLLKLWTSNQLSGDWSRWTLGGNLQAQSSNSVTTSSCTQPEGLLCNLPPEFLKLTQGSYLFLNLRAGYQIDSHWRAALSVNNIFDRVYYQTIYITRGGNWYGEPRGFVLRIDGKY